MKKNIKVLIAGVGGGGYGLEIMKSLRLSSLSCVIYACDMSKNALGLYIADKAYIIPSARSSNYLKVLLKICLKERIQVLIPGSDHDLARISENRSVFTDQGIFIPINSKEVINLGLDKMMTMESLKVKGFHVPKTILINSLKQVLTIDFMPVIIKPLTGGGSGNVFIAQDKTEMKFFCQYLINNGQKPLVQEYIGSGNDEYTVGVLSDQEGVVLCAVGIRRHIFSGLSNRLRIQSRKKNEMLVVSSGISQGEIIRDRHILDQCKRIAIAVQSRGPLNIQCRVVRKKVYVFEINPRLSGTTYIRALAGINEPDILIRKYVLKEKILKPLLLRYGHVLRGLVEEFIPVSQNKTYLIGKINEKH